MIKAACPGINSEEDVASPCFIPTSMLHPNDDPDFLAALEAIDDHEERVALFMVAMMKYDAWAVEATVARHQVLSFEEIKYSKEHEWSLDGGVDLVADITHKQATIRQVPTRKPSEIRPGNDPTYQSFLSDSSERDNV